MKISTLFTFLSLALAVSAVYSPEKRNAKNEKKVGHKKADKAAATSAAANATLVADPNVNAAANDGSKGEAAAALAQEAVDEFESGEAVTATAADAQATANVVKENDVLQKAGERRRARKL